MFNNIGSKLKAVAQIFCWIGIVFSVIMAIILFASNDRYNPTILPGFICLIVGPLSSWLGSIALYAFGELVELTERNAATNAAILRHLEKMPAPVAAPKAATPAPKAAAPAPKAAAPAPTSAAQTPRHTATPAPATNATGEVNISALRDMAFLQSLKAAQEAEQKPAE